MSTFYRTRTIQTIALLSSTLILVPVLGTTSSWAQEPKKGAPVAAPLALVAKTDQPTYKAGSAVKLTLTAKNTTQQEMLVRFSNGQRYDFELFRGNTPKGEKVWQWSKGMMFNMMVSATKLQPGKTMEYTQTYKSGGNGMPALNPGTYTVVATLKGAPKTDTPASPLSASTTFKVN